MAMTGRWMRPMAVLPPRLARREVSAIDMMTSVWPLKPAYPQDLPVNETEIGRGFSQRDSSMGLAD